MASFYIFNAYITYARAMKTVNVDVAVGTGRQFQLSQFQIHNILCFAHNGAVFVICYMDYMHC